MGHLPAAKHDRDFYLRSLFEKLDHLVPFGFKIVSGGAGPHLHFLQLNRLLMLASLVLPLAELVKVLTVIDDAAHGRVSRGGNFHKVQALASRESQSLIGRHDSQLPALFIDHPDFPGSNSLIYSNKSVGDRHFLPAPLAQ